MSKQITDWINGDLYPALFSKIDTTLQELEFKNIRGSKWISSKKRDGSKPKTPQTDKTVVTEKAPGLILENGDKAISIVDHIMSRDNLSFIDAVKKLADIAGLQLPKGDIDPATYNSYKEKEAILETCNSYFMYCLKNSPGANKVMDYLTTSRGYSNEDIVFMELGYIPSQDQLYSYLKQQGYSESLISEIKLTNNIGESHKLSIPFRTNGRIEGFIFRATTSTPIGSKYLNSTGLERSKTFFNIKPTKGDKDLIIVEGNLDALICSSRGVDNVVALGGTNISGDQVKDAIRRGAKKFTLCLDNDKAGASAILKAINTILAEGIIRIYVATLPASEGEKMDPDKYIIQHGAESFKQIIKEALPYYEYQLQETLSKYGEIEAQSGGLQPKDIDNLLDEVVETSAKIPDPIDRDRYKTLFTSLEAIQALGITPDSLDITVDRLTTTRDKENKEKDFKKLLSEATQLQSKGETDKALELLETKVKQVKLQDKATEFSKLLIAPSLDQIKQEETSLPDSLDSGFIIDGNELLIPGGAITVVAAPTNHGKTVALINMILNIANTYPDKKFIFFTYEERSNAILQYILNTYVNESLNSSDRSNRRLIREYFKSGDTQYWNKEKATQFIAGADKFFKTYIETGRIIVKYVDYNSSELSSAIEYLHKETGNLGGVFVDYFQLLRLPQDRYKSYGSRQEELKQICISLKDTSVETGLPLILAAQFNREVTNLERLHPTNIGEAGDIERIVNTLIGLWNMDKKVVLKGVTEPEKDSINKKIQTRLLSGEGEKNMYIEILKSRDLPTGSYDFLEFNGNTGKLSNRDKSEFSPFNQ